ncbi:hypothetical protein [Marinobacterium iners]|uniref:Uncharacterized protein n=1 Tax=Marinobacterium iners DSM 11526 TaxID=1122198 RepID=A0A1H4H405_9GAMM|nr:hypothetical protein [Marinobacterium iners]SEB16090.1 hypothetical protein SAMN02745729_1268 [Marinobacterium iners DSM 11526]
MTKPTFDMDAAFQALREGKDLTGPHTCRRWHRMHSLLVRRAHRNRIGVHTVLG